MDKSFLLLFFKKEGLPFLVMPKACYSSWASAPKGGSDLDDEIPF